MTQIKVNSEFVFDKDEILDLQKFLSLVRGRLTASTNYLRDYHLDINDMFRRKNDQRIKIVQRYVDYQINRNDALIEILDCLILIKEKGGKENGS